MGEVLEWRKLSSMGWDPKDLGANSSKQHRVVIRPFLGARDNRMFTPVLPLISCMALESVPQFPQECVGFAGHQPLVTSARAPLTHCHRHPRPGLLEGSAQHGWEGRECSELRSEQSGSFSSPIPHFN